MICLAYVYIIWNDQINTPFVYSRILIHVIKGAPPFSGITLKLIDLSLITKNRPLQIMKSAILMTLSKFQLAMHSLDHEQ